MSEEQLVCFVVIDGFRAYRTDVQPAV